MWSAVARVSECGAESRGVKRRTLQVADVDGDVVLDVALEETEVFLHRALAQPAHDVRLGPEQAAQTGDKLAHVGDAAEHDGAVKVGLAEDVFARAELGGDNAAVGGLLLLEREQLDPVLVNQHRRLKRAHGLSHGEAREHAQDAAGEADTREEAHDGRRHAPLDRRALDAHADQGRCTESLQVRLARLVDDDADDAVVEDLAACDNADT